MPIGQTASTTVSLKNRGSAPVQIAQFNLSGQPFAIVGPSSLPVTVAAGGRYSLNVQFIPAAAGTATGKLTVASDSSITGMPVITLSGTGTAGTGSAAVSALYCSSGTITGTTADSCTVMLTAPAPVDGLIVNLSSGSSSVAIPSSVVVPANATSAEFTVSASSVASSQAVTMTASAGNVIKSFTLQLNAAILALSINATTVAFGNVVVNTPATQSVILTSNGSVPVTINGATLAGAGFSLSGPTFPAKLNPGQEATLNLEFAPTAVGLATGQLTISSNSSTNATATIRLSGTGKQAEASSGATYYVDNCLTVGIDSNNGTSPSTPWLTVAHVNSQRLLPGDSVLFEKTCTWHEALAVVRSGSSIAPITFGSYGTGAKPIIDGNSSIDYAIHVDGANYILLSSLEVKGALKADINLQNSYYDTVEDMTIHGTQGHGIYAGLGGGGHTIENCDIYDVGTGPLFASGSGIQLNGIESPAVTVPSIMQYNYIHDLGNLAAGDHAIYDEVARDTDRYNRFKNIIGGTAMKVDGNGVLIYGNVFDSVPSGGVWIDPYSDVKVYNNTFYNVGTISPYAAVSFTGNGGQSGVTAENNIDYIPGDSYSIFLNLNSSALGFSSDYNDVFGAWYALLPDGRAYPNLLNWTQATGQDAHSISGNPVFANASASQFWLATGSPAISAGAYILGVSTINPPNIGAN